MHTAGQVLYVTAVPFCIATCDARRKHSASDYTCKFYFTTTTNSVSRQQLIFFTYRRDKFLQLTTATHSIYCIKRNSAANNSENLCMSFNYDGRSKCCNNKFNKFIYFQLKFNRASVILNANMTFKEFPVSHSEGRAK